MKTLLSRIREQMNGTTETMHCVRVSTEDLKKLLEDRDRMSENLSETQSLCNKQLLEIRGLTGGCADDPALKGVLARVNELPLSEEDLDELVHELKSQEASGINNGGRDEQVAYLLHVLGEKELFRQLENP